MIKRLSLCMLFLLMACGQEATLTFDTLHLESPSCADCPEVTLSLPHALERTKLADAINTALREEAISLLTFEDSLEVHTLERAIASFQKGYEDLKRLYEDESPGWKAEITATVSFEDAHRISIRLDAYTFTGGAHGYGTTRYLNFDKRKGAELEPWELVKNSSAFETYAERAFRLQEHIPEGQPLNSTGFMFEEGRFRLPENIGFTAEGLILHYNQYEVASYADGPIVLVLPYREVDAYLRQSVSL